MTDDDIKSLRARAEAFAVHDGRSTAVHVELCLVAREAVAALAAERERRENAERALLPVTAARIDSLGTSLSLGRGLDAINVRNAARDHFEKYGGEDSG